MTDPLNELTDLSDEQLAADPHIGMRRLAFEFLLQQEYFGTAAMMVAEFIAPQVAKQIIAASNPVSKQTLADIAAAE